MPYALRAWAVFVKNFAIYNAKYGAHKIADEIKLPLSFGKNQLRLSSFSEANTMHSPKA